MSTWGYGGGLPPIGGTDEERISDIRQAIYSLERDHQGDWNRVSSVLEAMLDEVVKIRQEYEAVARDGWTKSRDLYKELYEAKAKE